MQPATLRQNKPKPSDFYTTFRQFRESGQEKSRVYTRNFVNDYDFWGKTSGFRSDFGADTCDFHSDYASDFCDFPGDSGSDFGSDFGSEARHSSPRTAGTEGPEPAAAETAPPIRGQPSIRPQGRKGGGELAAHCKAATHG